MENWYEILVAALPHQISKHELPVVHFNVPAGINSVPTEAAL